MASYVRNFALSEMNIIDDGNAVMLIEHGLNELYPVVVLFNQYGNQVALNAQSFGLVRIDQTASPNAVTLTLAGEWISFPSPPTMNWTVRVMV